MIKVLNTTLWGREFSLPIIYDSLSDEIISMEQVKAVENFTQHLEWVEMSKAKVEEYCKDDVMGDDENQKKDNVFSYIKPETLFVERAKEYPCVAIMCKYRYDPEHGLAIVFSNDGEITVGSQDIIL